MKDARVRFTKTTPFSTEIRRRVDAYFERSGLARDGGAKMLIKTAIIFAWLIGSYVGLVMLGGGSWLAIVGFGISAGLATAGLGMAVQHDGGHLAYSSKRSINRASAAVLDLLGASSYVWRTKHGIVHHTWTNIEGTDDDIEAGPFARLAPSQPHHKFHRFQHIYMWPLYGFLTTKWLVYDDFNDLLRGRVGSYPIKPPRGVDLAIFVIGKVVHATWALIVPLILFGWLKGLVFYVMFAAACGVTLAVVFQLAHCVEEAIFVDPAHHGDALVLDFAAHQLATTIDFAPHSKWISWYVGGLNFQAVHHLFPRVSHLHYPALATIIAEAAKEYGIRYCTTPTLREALASHYRWLQRMGAGELAVAAPTGEDDEPEALPQAA